MNHEDLLLLAEYDRWATDRLLAAAARLPRDAWTQPVSSSLPCLRDALVHLVNSAVLWLARWQGRPFATGLRVAAFPDVWAVQARWNEATATMLAFLRQIPETQLLAPLAYRTATGRERRQVLGLTILHMMMHAAYHRGQAITVVRLLGGTTVHTDLLYFLSRRGKEGG